MQSFSLSATDRAIGAGTGSKAHRRFLDFVVDGQPLYPATHNYDLITPLCIGWPLAAAEGFGERLLGSVPGDAPGGRVAVFVCAECGDLGCGALTVEVRRSGDTVQWLSWGYENGYDGTVHPAEIDGRGEMTFDVESCRQVLVRGLDFLRRSRTSVPDTQP